MLGSFLWYLNISGCCFLGGQGHRVAGFHSSCPVGVGIEKALQLEKKKIIINVSYVAVKAA
jgi:hypothetical protein